MGNLWIRYAHMEPMLISDGDQVAPGTLLGLEGSTGFSTGPHLYFEVEDHPAAALVPLMDVDGPEFAELVEDHRDAAAIGPCAER